MTSFFPATQRGFTRQAMLVADLVRARPGPPQPTRLPGWSTAVLMGHIAAGLETLWRWRVDDPDNSIRVDSVQVDELAYWSPVATLAPTNSDWALGFAAGRSADELREVLIADVERAVDVVQAVSGNETIAPPRGNMWLAFDAFAQTRIVELTIHGFDLQHAYGDAPEADDTALSITAVLLDRRLATDPGGSRPDDLTDPIAWIEAATGRRDHEDPRLPVLS